MCLFSVCSYVICMMYKLKALSHSAVMNGVPATNILIIGYWVCLALIKAKLCFLGNLMIGCIHVFLCPNSLVVSFRRFVCRQAMPQISEARRLLPRSRAYRGGVSRREERTLRRQFSPPRARLPRPLLSRKRVLREVTRPSRLSARVLTSLQRGAQKRGVSLVDPALSYRELVANDPDESESERPRAKTATEKRKLASASRRQRQV